MAIHTDRKFLHMLSPKLERFVRKKEDLYNFRCPLCGDSKKNKLKCRGFVFRKKSEYFMMCHNCGASHTLYNFMKLVDPSLVKEYSMERYREASNGREIIKEPEVEKPKKPPVFRENINLPNILELPENHYVKTYIDGRQIPKSFHSQLYFTEDFKKFVESMNIEKEDLIDNDHRIVIPFYNEQKELVAFQGRSVGDSKLRYIAISIVPGFKFYGMDRIDRSKKVYVLEGPIDSMFIPNAIATGDSDLTRVGILGLPKSTLIYDNEPRNLQIIRQMEDAIDMGYNICIWPEDVEEKDINEMVLEGTSIDDIVLDIDTNTYSGLRAKLELSKWRKV